MALFTNAARDIGVTAILSPESACGLSNSEQVRVEIFNYGQDLNLTFVDISYSINGGAPVTQSPFYTSFDSLETKTITFVNQANLSASGSYELKVYTSLGSDADRTNDTMIVTVINHPMTVGGNLMTNNTVCSGNNKDTLFLSGNVGDVQQWEYTEDDGASWIPIVNADTFQIYTNLVTTRWYRSLVKSGTCPSMYSDTVIVTVDETANAGTLENSATVCSGSNADTLQLTNYNGTILKWQFNNGGGWIDIANTEDTLSYKNLTITTSYRTIVQNGTCPDDTSNIITISVINFTDGGNISGSDTVCSGSNFDTLFLTGHTGDIRWWESSTDGGFTWVPIANTDTQQVYNNLSQTTQYRILVEADGCPDAYSDTVTIQVDSNTVGGTIMSSSSVCGGSNGDTLLLSGHLGSVLSWEFNDGAGWMTVNNTTDSLIYMNLIKSTNYRAIVKNGVCPITLSDEVAITVIDVTIGGKIDTSNVVCAISNNDTLQLKSHVGDIKWWERSTDNGFSWTPVVNATTSQIYNNLSQTTLYRVLVQGDGCPDVYSDTATILVDQQAIGGVINGATTVCSGTNNDTLRLASYNGNIVKWQFNEGAAWQDSMLTTDFYEYSNLTMTTNYRVIIESGVCPQDTSIIATVIVSEPTVAGTIAAHDTVCSGDNGDTLILSGHNGAVVRWENSTDNGATWTNTSNTDIFQIYDDLTITTAYRALIQSGVCTALYTDSVVITVETVSKGGVVGNDTLLCDSTNNGMLELVNYMGDILNWQSLIDTTGAVWQNIANTSTTQSYNNITNTTFYRAVVKNGTCVADTSDQTKLTSSITTADFSTNNVCFNDTMFFTNLSTVGNGNVILNAWEFGDNEASIAKNPKHLYVTTGSFDVRLVISTDKGCTDTATKTVEVYELPDPSITVIGLPEFCDGDSVELSGVGGMTSYSWNTGSNNQSIMVKNEDTYSLTVTDNNNCMDSSAIFITVFPLPDIDAGNDTTISLGQSVPLNASGGETYLWTPASSLNNANIQNPIATPFETTQYTVLGTDINGCENKDSLTITVIEDYDFTVSNLMTPNGDGYNDEWFIENIQAYPDCQIALFNRFGQELFVTSNYTNDFTGEFNGESLPDGTYYYVITCPGTDVEFKGHLTIITD